MGFVAGRGVDGSWTGSGWYHVAIIRCLLTVKSLLIIAHEKELRCVIDLPLPARSDRAKGRLPLAILRQANTQHVLISEPR